MYGDELMRSIYCIIGMSAITAGYISILSLLNFLEALLFIYSPSNLSIYYKIWMFYVLSYLCEKNG